MVARLFGWLLAACFISGVAAADESPVLVFDAASLTNVIDDLSKAFTDETHVPVKSSPAASSALAKQIEAGAPADVFFSADLEWMDYLDQKKLLKPGTRHNVGQRTGSDCAGGQRGGCEVEEGRELWFRENRDRRSGLGARGQVRKDGVGEAWCLGQGVRADCSR